MLRKIIEATTVLRKHLAHLCTALTLRQRVKDHAAAQLAELDANPFFKRSDPKHKVAVLADLEAERQAALDLAAGVLAHEAAKAWPSLETDLRAARKHYTAPPSAIDSVLGSQWRDSAPLEHHRRTQHRNAGSSCTAPVIVRN